MRSVSIYIFLLLICVLCGCSEKADRTQILAPYLKTDRKPTEVLRAPESTPPLDSAQKEYEKNSESKGAAMRYAMACYQAEDYSAARRVLKAIETKDPEGEFLRLLYLAACEEMFELWPKAAESYKTAADKTEDKDNKVESLYLAGYCLLASNKMKEARTCFESVLAMNSRHFRTMLGLFYLNLLGHKDSEAEKGLKVIESSATGDARVLAKRAREAFEKVRR